MSEDRTWRLPWSRADLPALRIAAEDVARGFAGVSASVEDEGEGDLTVFFTVPGDPEAEFEEQREDSTCELAVYEIDGRFLLCLEWDAADNSWLDDEADQLAEEMADALEGRPV
ncbi:MAG: hypothetical protein VX265_00780 [Myxococcota bacterium]|nr:hypothetical protein [Myxococcota bacterium]